VEDQDLDKDKLELKMDNQLHQPQEEVEDLHLFKDLVHLLEEVVVLVPQVQATMVINQAL
jgi:hypothetical protein